MTQEEYRSAVTNAFQFLIDDFNCRVEYPLRGPSEVAWASGYDVDFINKVLCVEIGLQLPENLPTVHLRRLAALVGMRNVFPLGLLILVRAPERNPLKDVSSLPLSKNVRQLVLEYADALKRTAGDVLRGDFSVFPKLQEEAASQMAKRTSRSDRDFVFF